VENNLDTPHQEEREMSVRFGRLSAAAVVAVSVIVGRAEAQIITGADVPFTPANNNRPATVNPRGTVSLPGDGKVYRVNADRLG
jgi:hypothetical protein